MNRVKDKYLTYLNDRIEEHKRNSEAYKADDRKDEANLEMIKANICEVFRTLFITDTKQLEQKDLSNYKDINLFADYLLRFDTIPTNWKVSLEKAKVHGDTTKQVIEETKLEVAKELKEQLNIIFNAEVGVL